MSEPLMSAASSAPGGMRNALRVLWHAGVMCMHRRGLELIAPATLTMCELTPLWLCAGEMIVGPKRVLFLDEISTGLDSSTTFDIVKYLRVRSAVSVGLLTQVLCTCILTLAIRDFQPSVLSLCTPHLATCSSSE